MDESTARPYRDVLAIRGARTLIGASAASEIGNWRYNAALLGYVYSATRSAGWVGAATVCRSSARAPWDASGSTASSRCQGFTSSSAPSSPLSKIRSSAPAAICSHREYSRPKSVLVHYEQV